MTCSYKIPVVCIFSEIGKKRDSCLERESHCGQHCSEKTIQEDIYQGFVCSVNYSQQYVSSAAMVLGLCLEYRRSRSLTEKMAHSIKDGRMYIFSSSKENASFFFLRI